MSRLQLPFEASLLMDLEDLERRAGRGEEILPHEITALLNRYGASFGELPPYLQEAVDRVDLTER